MSLPALLFSTVLPATLALYREVASRGPHGLESDVWSLGCMLYTLFTGRPPFDVRKHRPTVVPYLYYLIQPACDPACADGWGGRPGHLEQGGEGRVPDASGGVPGGPGPH